MTIQDCNYANEFLDDNDMKISQIHTSFINRSMQDHGFLYKNDSEQVRKMIMKIKSLNVPIVLEAVASMKEEIDDIFNEINYIKNIN